MTPKLNKILRENMNFSVPVNAPEPDFGPEPPDTKIEPGFEQAFQNWLKQQNNEQDYQQFLTQYPNATPWDYLNQFDALEQFQKYCDHDLEFTEKGEEEDGRVYNIFKCTKCGADIIDGLYPRR